LTQLTESSPFDLQDRESRAYIHSKCGTVTEVNSEALMTIADAFESVAGTRCAQCGVVPFASVKWVETGETLADYRARIRNALDKKLGFPPLLVGGVVSAIATVVVVGIIVFDDGNQDLLTNVGLCVAATLGGFVMGVLGMYKAKSGLMMKYCIRHKIRLTSIT
jgi:hypothetical protein